MEIVLIFSIPALPYGNTNADVIMIAEKLCDAIRMDYGETPPPVNACPQPLPTPPPGQPSTPQTSPIQTLLPLKLELSLL